MNRTRKTKKQGINSGVTERMRQAEESANPSTSEITKGP